MLFIAIPTYSMEAPNHTSKKDTSRIKIIIIHQPTSKTKVDKEKRDPFEDHLINKCGSQPKDLAYLRKYDNEFGI